MTIVLKLKLAREFGSGIQEVLSRSEFRKVLERNKTADDLTCHTHDFIDANMVMFDAFDKVIGHSFRLDDDSDVQIFNDAWAIAKAAEFFE